MRYGILGLKAYNFLSGQNKWKNQFVIRNLFGKIWVRSREAGCIDSVVPHKMWLAWCLLHLHISNMPALPGMSKKSHFGQCQYDF